MNIMTLVLSFIYSLGQISLGLLVHPYQTMQSLVKEKIFVWMVLLPSVFLALVTLIYRFVLVPTISLIFSCQISNFFFCNYIVSLANFVTFFCIYWQLMLFYLLLRFSDVFNNEHS